MRDPKFSESLSLRFYKPDVCLSMRRVWMKIIVKFYAHLREQVGMKKMVKLTLKEGAKISQLLDEIIQDSLIKKALLDKNQKLKSGITLLKNGREIKFLAGMETELDTGDEVSIFPMVVGG
jgi:molybdopterin synthase sulfur carrier subunit